MDVAIYWKLTVWGSNRQYGKWSKLSSAGKCLPSNLDTSWRHIMLWWQKNKRPEKRSMNLDYINVKLLCIREQYQRKWKDKPQNGRRDLQTTYKDLKSEYKPHNSTIKETTQLKMSKRIWIDISLKKRYVSDQQQAEKTISLVTGEIQINTTTTTTSHSLEWLTHTHTKKMVRNVEKLESFIHYW